MRLSPKAIERIKEHIEFAFDDEDKDESQLKADLQTLLDIYLSSPPEKF